VYLQSHAAFTLIFVIKFSAPFIHYKYPYTQLLSFILMLSPDECETKRFKQMNTLLSASFKFCITKSDSEAEIQLILIFKIKDHTKNVVKERSSSNYSKNVIL